MSWNTDIEKLAEAVAEFERRLPGFWWSVGQCAVGAHASCAVDARGCQAHLLNDLGDNDPFDEGFDVDTESGAPHEALLQVMELALRDPRLKGPALQAADN